MIRKKLCSDSEKNIITLERYVFAHGFWLANVLDKVRGARLSEPILISPTFKECNRHAVIFPTVASANHFVGLSPRALRNL